jgi:sulfite reductase alpha subunit-like flavoprotein
MRRFLLTVVTAGIALLLSLVSVIGQTKEEIARDKILASGPEWQQKYDKYQPAADMVEALKAKMGANMKIDVYLGIWCPDSRNNVPPFIKILDLVGTGVPIRYFDVPRKASRDVKYYVEEMNVERVPSFIFFRDGKEVGRIIENPKMGMIEDMMEILFK